MNARSGSPPAARLALIALLAANVVLALGPWLVRLAQSESHVGPLASAFWRLALALPVLVLASVRRGEARPARPANAFALATLAGLFFAADLGAWHVGILHTRLANATLLGNVSAVIFPAYGFLVARRWPTRRQGTALLLAAAGAVLLMGRSYELSARNLAGDLTCVFAGLCYTGYLVVIDRMRGRLGPATTLAISVAAGVPVLLIVTLGLAEPLRPDSWTPLILLALGSQLFGQGLILYAVSRVPPLVVGVMLLVQPVVASGVGWLIFGERLSLFDLAGGIGIAVAVLLVRDARRLPGGEMRLKSPA